ncbi:MAG TPA: hypothetical protein VIP57_03635 [Candidatus Dormibacteraeota bacterium]
MDALDTKVDGLDVQMREQRQDMRELRQDMKAGFDRLQRLMLQFCAGLVAALIITLVSHP